MSRYVENCNAILWLLYNRVCKNCEVKSVHYVNLNRNKRENNFLQICIEVFNIFDLTDCELHNAETSLC